MEGDAKTLKGLFGNSTGKTARGFIWEEGAVAVISRMALLFGSLTVDLVGAGIKAAALRMTDHVEVYKTLNGKTVGAYKLRPNTRVYYLSIDNMTVSMMDEIHSLWIQAAPREEITYRDYRNAERQVLWLDEHFPFERVGFDQARGEILLEEVA